MLTILSVSVECVSIGLLFALMLPIFCILTFNGPLCSFNTSHNSASGGALTFERICLRYLTSQFVKDWWNDITVKASNIPNDPWNQNVKCTLTSACLMQSTTSLCSSTYECWDTSGDQRLCRLLLTWPLCPTWLVNLCENMENLSHCLIVITTFVLRASSVLRHIVQWHIMGGDSYYAEKPEWLTRRWKVLS